MYDEDKGTQPTGGGEQGSHPNSASAGMSAEKDVKGRTKNKRQMRLGWVRLRVILVIRLLYTLPAASPSE